MTCSDLFLAPIALYAETHFRFFRFFPNLLFRKIPEVVFDCPRRIAPGADLPILLLVNDIDRFPARCESIRIAVTHRGGETTPFVFDQPQLALIQHPLSGQSAAYLINLPRLKLPSGLVYINCAATIKIRNKTYQVLNDNLVGTSKLAFSCFISEESLPGKNLSALGDVHVHSQYSQSHVEFGPPLAVIDEFSKSYGNDFVVITDHSYDLACSMNNYLLPDSELPRWRSIHDEISQKTFKNTLIVGEEISCLNSKGKVVHLCGIGLKNYIPGSLDGARKKNKKNVHHTIPSAIMELNIQQGLAFAAHPGSTMGFLQKTFLHRGNWNQNDFTNPLDGIQGINNGFGKSWSRAKKLWINELLKGHKLSLIAGNDSHGDFNRYRFLSVPFISIDESFNRFFSFAMTGIYTTATSQSDIIHGLKKGKTYVTTGPFISVTSTDNPSVSLISNDDVNIGNVEFVINILSSKEFGTPHNIRVYCGEHNAQKELCIFQKFNSKKDYQYLANVLIPKQIKRGYIRAEAECLKDNAELSFCATSPCYFFR